MLHDRIAPVFDINSIPDAYYVGIFASFPSFSGHGLELACLALYPMEDETTQNAEEHVAFLFYVLRSFKSRSITSGL